MTKVNMQHKYSTVIMQDSIRPQGFSPAWSQHSTIKDINSPAARTLSRSFSTCSGRKASEAEQEEHDLTHKADFFTDTVCVCLYYIRQLDV